MVFGDAAGAVSQLLQEHRYRPRTSHGVSLRPRRTRVKRSPGRDYETFLCFISLRIQSSHARVRSFGSVGRISGALNESDDVLAMDK